MTDCDATWFAVRTVIGTPWVNGRRSYEERITLWRSPSVEDAFRRARADAVAHASLWEPPAEILSLQQSFELFDEPGDGAEVFSLIRDSELPADTYLDQHFDTGRERQGQVE